MIPIQDTVPRKNPPIATRLIILLNCLVFLFELTMPVGASGALAGVMGAYFFLFPSARIIVLLPVLFIPLFFELPAVVYRGIWALTQVFGGTLSSVGPGDVSGIAWWGHVDGFCAGILLHFLFVKRGSAYRRLSRDEYGIEGAWVPAGT
jgi:membrane associated rhomboid family serine protease